MTGLGLPDLGDVEGGETLLTIYHKTKNSLGKDKLNPDQKKKKKPSNPFLQVN